MFKCLCSVKELKQEVLLDQRRNMFTSSEEVYKYTSSNERGYEMQHYAPANLVAYCFYKTMTTTIQY